MTRTFGKTLLHITTSTNRPHVLIDGVGFELREPKEFGAVESKRLGHQGDRLQSLMKATTLSEADETEIGTLLDTLTRAILVAPEDVHRKLFDSHRAQIFVAFTAMMVASDLSELTSRAPAVTEGAVQ